MVAGPRFNRWWVIVGSLAINLSIGQAYAFSVFNLPLTRVRGVTTSAPGDWTLPQLGWIFTLAYVFLGLSAGFGGRWQDRVGPRMSGLVAAACFGGGLLLSALGVHLHQIWLLYVGYGVVGGCGLGLGFNTPISPLIRWFPDRRGLATGLAIMGFGGGAIVAAPLSVALLDRFASPTSSGVVETFIVLGIVYFLTMSAGALLFRLPPPGWRPPGWTPPAGSLAGGAYVPVAVAVRTRQFYLLWSILLLNVSAGIGILGQAAAMVQEVFDGFSAQAAAWFVAVLSFFNMCGRLVWASLSDVIGRRLTYAIFFALGTALYIAVPFAGRAQSLVLFVGCFAVILSMYGGGFAAMPPYIAELFESRDVGAIHGRVLTALSVAGVVGPTLVNYLRDYWIAIGYEKSQAYDNTMWILASLLVIGFVANAAVMPVAADRFAGETTRPPRPEEVAPAEARASLPAGVADGEAG